MSMCGDVPGRERENGKLASTHHNRPTHLFHAQGPLDGEREALQDMGALHGVLGAGKALQRGEGEGQAVCEQLGDLGVVAGNRLRLGENIPGGQERAWESLVRAMRAWLCRW